MQAQWRQYLRIVAPVLNKRVEKAQSETYLRYLQTRNEEPCSEALMSPIHVPYILLYIHDPLPQLPFRCKLRPVESLSLRCLSSLSYTMRRSLLAWRVL